MYYAIVARIHTRPHPNADRLLIGTVANHQVIVGLDTPDNALGVFFPPDGQLNEAFCKTNKLLREDGGYMEPNRRVRAVKLRGVKSEGLWLPIEALAGYGDYKEGDLVSGTVCQRYETPATRRAMAKMPKRDKDFIAETFLKHQDTAQLRFMASFIPDKSVLYFSEKMHGTSGRFGYVKTKRKSPWWRRWWKPFTEQYEHLVGTRNVTLTAEKLAQGNTFYGAERFRFDAVQPLHGRLREGETLFFELVGYTETGQHIMAPQTIKDKELEKFYGKQMVYRYSQALGTCGIYVYAITQATSDGHVMQLSWPQVAARCRELGVGTVQLVGNSVSVHYTDIDGIADNLIEYTNSLLDGPSMFDGTHIREGVVLRIETLDGDVWFLKSKSFTFGVLEGYLKDDDNVVDLEEIA